MGLLASLLLAACDGGSTCAFNSDCPSGSYCRDGGCFVDCSDDVPCPMDQVCTSFGQCVPSTVEDAGPSDGGPPPDGGTTCATRGGTDRDEDGYCADDPVEPDCDDGDRDVSPAADEVCTPSTEGSSMQDENCDGVIDEGCAWHFGTPHWITRPLVAGPPTDPNHNIMGSLSPDSRALYFVHCPRSGVRCTTYVAERASPASSFGAPRPLSGPSIATYSGAFPVFTSDGIEAYFVARDIYRATPVDAATFGVFELVTELATDDAAEEGLTLSRDGLEMILTRGRQLYRTTRASRTSPWSAPVALTGIPFPEVNTPSLTPDGRTLFFYGRAAAGLPYRIYRAERADVTTGTFATPIEVSEPDPGDLNEYFFPVVSTSTREIFFGATGGWTPAGYGIWRAQICRDGPCPEDEIPCPAPGRRSLDRTHCYTPGPSAATQADARAACMARTPAAHLATLHSEAERTLVWTFFGSSASIEGTLWMGATDSRAEGTWEWDTGEPVTYLRWGGGDPSSGTAANGLALWWTYDGLLADEAQSQAYRYVCETELWPTW